MSFTFLSTAAVLGGIGVLAVLLGILHRLRVQHREVEVVRTLFWQAAVEETRACVRQTISTLASVVAHSHDRVVSLGLVCGAALDRK